MLRRRSQLQRQNVFAVDIFFSRLLPSRLLLTRSFILSLQSDYLAGSKVVIDLHSSLTLCLLFCVIPSLWFPVLKLSLTKLQITNRNGIICRSLYRALVPKVSNYFTDGTFFSMRRYLILRLFFFWSFIYRPLLLVTYSTSLIWYFLIKTTTTNSGYIPADRTL